MISVPNVEVAEVIPETNFGNIDEILFDEVQEEPKIEEKEEETNVDFLADIKVYKDGERIQ